MSLIPVGVGIVEAAVQGLLQSVFLRTRSIGPFVANVTIEERHIDELRITDHPVERNAVISDHAFKLPMRVTIQAGYSNSSFESGGDPNYVNDVYRQFLALQESRELIFILTGKRLYENMLIERLAVTTDEKTENALFLTVEMREIILVTTQTVSVPSTSVMRAPGVTGATQSQGTVQLSPGTAANQAAGAAALPQGAQQ